MHSGDAPSPTGCRRCGHDEADHVGTGIAQGAKLRPGPCRSCQCPAFEAQPDPRAEEKVRAALEEMEDLKRKIDERCEDEGKQEFGDRLLEKLRERHVGEFGKLEDLRRGPDAEPEPTPGEADVTSLVIADLKRRSDFGARKYGTRLQTFNGRDALKDFYAELLDGCCYIRQRIEEEESLEQRVIELEALVEELRENPPSRWDDGLPENL